MSDLIEQMRRGIEIIITTLGYPGLTLVMAFEQIVPPIPSGLVMVLAGFLVSAERFSFAGVVLAGTLGAVLGALALYIAGWWGDETIIRRVVRRYGGYLHVSEANLDTALDWFGRYGAIAICAGQCVPIVRSVIAIPAGMRRMPLPAFLLATALGAAVWTTMLAYAGMLLRQNWAVILRYVELYERVVAGLLVAALALFIIRRMVAARRAPAAQ